jgi:hypothetical protein
MQQHNGTITTRAVLADIQPYTFEVKNPPTTECLSRPLDPAHYNGVPHKRHHPEHSDDGSNAHLQ